MCMRKYILQYIVYLFLLNIIINFNKQLLSKERVKTTFVLKIFLR